MNDDVEGGKRGRSGGIPAIRGPSIVFHRYVRRERARRNIPGPCPEPIWIPRRGNSNEVVIRWSQGEHGVIGYAPRMNENCGLDLRMEPPFARAPVNDRWDGSILLFHVWKGRPSFSRLWRNGYLWTGFLERFFTSLVD